MEYYAILNDIHFPFETKDYPLVLKILRDIPGLNKIYLNGDIGEFQTVSSHLKTPGGMSLLKEECKIVNQRLDELQAYFPRCEITFIEGNHCYRLDRYIKHNAPALYGIDEITIPRLLYLKERRMKHVKYGPRQLQKCGNSNLYLRHEPLTGGENHAKITSSRSTVDVAYGHTHVYQQYTFKNIGPGSPTITATSLGFLGDMDADIFNYRGSKDIWVNGFGLVQCHPESGKYRLDFTKLDDGLAIYNGKVYKR